VADQILVPAFQALFDLEQQVTVDQGLRFFPFQPIARPKEDCLWNWILPGMGLGLHPFDDGPPVLGMDFPIELQLDRNFG
jgi:hypothetical protein